MKIKLTILLVLVFTSFPMAKIWRVNKDIVTKADFTQITTAINDPRVIPGDTLYVEGIPGTYDAFSLNKKLVIIGNGFFLNENPNTQTNKNSSSFGGLTIVEGAEGSELISLTILGNCAIQCNNITFKRNFFYGRYLQIVIHGSFTDISFFQNFISSEQSTSVYVGDNCSRIIIYNNYLKRFDGDYAITVPPTSSVWMEQNTIQGRCSLGSGIFRNNIVAGAVSNDNSVTEGNYIFNGTLSDVIVNTGSTDGKLKLQDGSPAKTAGVNGSECGMFGGDEPYVLSGIPSIPSIYEAIVPDKVKSGDNLNVTIKAKTNK